jgi:thioredoxin reductase
MNATKLPVAVIGAGPVGLAAAVRLMERGLVPLVLEAGQGAAASVEDWAHVRLFSPWRYNVDKAAAKLLEATGWKAPPAEDLPTGGDLVREYLRPLAAHEALRPHVRFDHKVTAVARRGMDKVRTADRASVPFIVRTESSDGTDREIAVAAVIDASGTWRTPNPLGAQGLPAVGEARIRHRVHYGIPDVLGKHREAYAGKTTLVVGAGHSAGNSILGLAQLAKSTPGTAIVWATRGDELSRVLGGGVDDGLPARAKIGDDLKALIDAGSLSLLRGFRIEAVREAEGKVVVSGTRSGEAFSRDGVDRIIVATGQRPDLDIARELRLSIDPVLECSKTLGPLIDPNEHSCGTVRPHGARELAHMEEGFYVIGSKSYGRAPTFLLLTGYEQARSVVAMIAGDVEAAERVELELPETGVCRVDAPKTAGGCCGPTPKACC